ILIPYPWAADDHQFYNAQSFADSGAAKLMPQRNLTAKALADAVAGFIRDKDSQDVARRALDKWFFPSAASDIADKIFPSINRSSGIVEMGRSGASLVPAGASPAEGNARKPHRLIGSEVSHGAPKNAWRGAWRDSRGTHPTQTQL